MIKTFFKTFFIAFGGAVLLLLCVFFLSFIICAPKADDRLCTKNNPIVSPSGEFTAEYQQSPSNERGFVIRILDKSGNHIYTCDCLFLSRFSNFICWADDADILWGYNGDIGTFYWIPEEDGWIKYVIRSQRAYAGCFVQYKDENGELYYVDIAELPSISLYAPQALKDLRPNTFSAETDLHFALPENCKFTKSPQGAQRHLP